MDKDVMQSRDAIFGLGFSGGVVIQELGSVWKRIWELKYFLVIVHIK